MKKFIKVLILVLIVMLVFGKASSISADNPNLPLGQTAYTTDEIIVNGVEIEAPRPSLTDGVIMLPLRPIVEELGFDIFWDGNERRIDIGENYMLWIGQPKFSQDGGLTTREFGPAPEIIDGRTFVPISLFNYGFAGYSAKIEAGKVIINTLNYYR